MQVSAGNLYEDVPERLAQEQVLELLAAEGLRIERIVSTGQASPAGFWYEQERAEWVVLLRGSALLKFADEPDARKLGPGDYVYIPAGARHRVEWTDEAQPTVWLAIHYDPSEVAA
jgi:cupin 2 domain-containing protein